MKVGLRGAFRQWPVGLLVEIITYVLVAAIASLIALLAAGTV